MSHKEMNFRNRWLAGISLGLALGAGMTLSCVPIKETLLVTFGFSSLFLIDKVVAKKPVKGIVSVISILIGSLTGSAIVIGIMYLLAQKL